MVPAEREVVEHEADAEARRIDAVREAWVGAELPELWARAAPGVAPETFLTVVYLSRIGRLFEAALERLVHEHGLGAGEFRVMSALLLTGPPHRLTPSRLNRTVVMSSGGMTKTVDRLEQLGLVERARDPDDGRGVLVTMTRRGRRVTGDALAALMAEIDDQLAGLDGAQRAAIPATLHALLGTFPGGFQAAT